MSAIKALRNFCETQKEKCYPFKNEFVLWDDDTNGLSVFIDENNELSMGCEVVTSGMFYYYYITTEDDAFAIIKHLIKYGEISLKTNDSV